MTIPIPLLATIGMILFTFISTLLWRTLDKNSESQKKTNDIIAKNTEAFNNLMLVVRRLEVKSEDKEILCNAVHSSVNARLKGHDEKLKEHSAKINDLQIRTK